MAKTYVIPSSAVTGFRYTSTTNSIIKSSDYTLTSANRYFGRDSSARYAVRIDFSGNADMQHCFDLYKTNSAAITSIKLTLGHTASSYDKNFYAGATIATTGTKHASGTSIPIAKSKTSEVIDITSFGITNQLAYSVGALTDSSSVRLTANASQTLTIITSEVDRTLSYNANGGTGAPAAQTIVTANESDVFTVSNVNPTRTGYSFLGWATTSSATSAKYAAGSSITIKTNTTLYAVWKPDEYTVKYDPNGGSGEPASQIKYHGTTLTLSSDKPARTGYTFQSWNTVREGTGTSYAPGASYTTNTGVTLYAQWTANKYKVDCEGATITVTYDEPYGALPVPHKDGYTFETWALEDGTPINASSIVKTAADHRLISAWTPNRYIVEYTDTVTTIERPIIMDQPWNAEGALFSKPGYHQVEWETDSGYTVEFGSEQRTWGNQLLYAVFSPNEYTITFDSDGGTSFPDKHVYYNSKVGTLPRPEKEKHTFLGWYVNGIRWTADTVYSITDNVTLVAMWEEDKSGYYNTDVYIITESGPVPARFGKVNADGSVSYGESYVISES